MSRGFLRTLTRLNKPHYVFRPRQIVRRLEYERLRRAGRLPDPGSAVLPWGLELEFHHDDVIGSSIARLGLYELVTTELIMRLCDAGETAVDVGANVGHMTSAMAAATHPGGTVVAFEPHPAVFEELQANVARWPAPIRSKTFVHRLAVSREAGTALLVEDDAFEGNRGTARLWTDGADGAGERVPTISLDEAFPDATIGLLKLDIEGNELAALEGATALLGSGRVRDVLFEEHEPVPTPTTRLLESFAYRVFAVEQRLSGPRLVVPSGRVVRPSWDPPNLIATTDPERLVRRLKARGWKALRGGRQSPSRLRLPRPR